MLYLEDYLEMIEHLPQELRDRFTDMREYDLQVQNAMDMLDKRVKMLFANASKTKVEDRDKEFDDIIKCYIKTLEDADEKVTLATHAHDMVERYLRRLENECHKFKMELEADNRGITEILEKSRSMDVDIPAKSSSSQKENMYVRSTQIIDHGSRRGSRRDSVLSTSTDKQEIVVGGGGLNVGSVLIGSNAAELQMPSAAPSNVSLTANSVGTSHPEYNLAHIGAGGTAIAAAASQAIAATQRLQHGRRSASLRASYDAISGGGVNGFGRELAGAAQTAIQASHYEAARKHKKANVSMTATTSSQMENMSIEEDTSTSAGAAGAEASANTEEDWVYDPNEPRYCFCNQVSYGDMVACDNPECPFEWFHYPCVNVTCPPKGKWFCPQCSQTRRRRKN